VIRKSEAEKIYQQGYMDGWRAALVYLKDQAEQKQQAPDILIGETL
jgi:hypothetical protein